MKGPLGPLSINERKKEFYGAKLSEVYRFGLSYFCDLISWFLCIKILSLLKFNYCDVYLPESVVYKEV